MKPLIGLCILAALGPSLAGGNRQNDPRKPIRIPGEQKAPEFTGIAEWLNSKPLTMEELRGKVVVVHFMTFG
jgi:hypothetical protein